MSEIQKNTATATVPVNQDNGETAPGQRFLQPRASVYGDDNGIIVELEMPGVGRDQVEVTVDNDELTVTGWRKPEGYEDYEVLHRERLPLNYRRTFVVGDQIDSGHIGAAFENGVLKLTLPKAEASKPRKITIT